MEKCRKHICGKLLAAGLAAALVFSTAACSGNSSFPGGEPGELPSGAFPGGEPGELPSGEVPGGEPGELPSGEVPGGQRPGQNGGQRPGQNGGQRPGQNGWGPGWGGDPSGTKESATAPDISDAGIEIPDGVTGEFRITTAGGRFTQSGNVWTITAAGTYVLSGVLEDGQVRIEAGEEDVVELDFNGAAITCASDAPVCAVSAGKLKIKAMAGTENLVNDTRPARTDENDSSSAGAVWAACDLSFSGTGSLTVIGTYNNGVHTKDDLKIKELTLSVAAPNNALKGNDSVTVESGAVKLVSTGGDGIKTENTGVSEKGNQRGIITVEDGTLGIWAATDGFDASYDVVIEGGSISVTAGDDGIHAENLLRIDGGTVEIANSHEGLEGHDVQVNGGVIRVFADDDGVNAAGSGGFSTDGLITVTGGELYVEVTGRDVDGIDSNGSYRQTGGFVVVSNPYADASGNMSAVDAAGKVEVTGGTVIALGTVPGQGGQGGKGGWGGFFGMGGMNGGSKLPDGAVTFSGTLQAGAHSFSCGSVKGSFTLKSAVSGGWIWSPGISADNYTLD